MKDDGLPSEPEDSGFYVTKDFNCLPVKQSNGMWCKSFIHGTTNVKAPLRYGVYDSLDWEVVIDSVGIENFPLMTIEEVVSKAKRTMKEGRKDD